MAPTCPRARRNCEPHGFHLGSHFCLTAGGRGREWGKVGGERRAGAHREDVSLETVTTAPAARRRRAGSDSRPFRRAAARLPPTVAAPRTKVPVTPIPPPSSQPPIGPPGSSGAARQSQGKAAASNNVCAIGGFTKVQPVGSRAQKRSPPFCPCLFQGRFEGGRGRTGDIPTFTALPRSSKSPPPKSGSLPRTSRLRTTAAMPHSSFPASAYIDDHTMGSPFAGPIIPNRASELRHGLHSPRPGRQEEEGGRGGGEEPAMRSRWEVTACHLAAAAASDCKLSSKSCSETAPPTVKPACGPCHYTFRPLYCGGTPEPAKHTQRREEHRCRRIALLRGTSSNTSLVGMGTKAPAGQSPSDDNLPLVAQAGPAHALS